MSERISKVPATIKRSAENANRNVRLSVAQKRLSKHRWYEIV